MGYTITEKILLKHTKAKDIYPGQFINAKVDICLANDITAPLAIEEFGKLGVKKVFDKKKIVLVPDHFTPAKDMKSANQCKIMANFARQYEIKNYFEVGRMGIEHALLPEMGLVLPGDLIIGADSHTCTYGALGAFSTGVGSTDFAICMITGECWLKVPESMKIEFFGRLNKWVGGKDLILHTIGDIGVDGARYMAMEFYGETIENLPMDDRFSMCNMAIEAGAKSGIIAPDKITMRYIKAIRKGLRPGIGKFYSSAHDAKYAYTKEYDARKIEPLVSCPNLPSNVKRVRELKEVYIDQVVIGSCTNGRISDLQLAAKVLRGKKVNSRVRMIVIPATQGIYLEAVKEGLSKLFVEAGGVFSTPTCGPCLGGHMGILAEGETAISTTNRNFIGRMGHPGSRVYLSNPAVAAASAIKGRIAHPDEVM
ncbi:MAG: 3-isopropylmalate dehydratase large subunit [Omnitrophica bacterium RIFCSPLOWO2_01_FULL_45_10]|nr:MAG: 3-isopropylmalate dehydratase large subunit [Omnitrophica bacterium RIFCSPLOWO2_01_FULL_45_10]